MTNVHKKTMALIGFTCLILTSGCLRSDVTETWYVDGNGAVTWVILEQNVRSDSQDPTDRRTEENEYWLGVQQDRQRHS